MYKLSFTKIAIKDFKLIEQIGLKNTVENLLKIISKNPFQNPPAYKKRKGSSNVYSRRINKQHRLVYEIYDEAIKIISLWGHYE
ncbi:MAG: Txe/YoeB family addiction module toxin [Firmicutes bacterium]|nr:Txe/YoeB family addiction module toxin [Bacillota bacterium]